MIDEELIKKSSESIGKKSPTFFALTKTTSKEKIEIQCTKKEGTSFD